MLFIDIICRVLRNTVCVYRTPHITCTGIFHTVTLAHNDVISIQLVRTALGSHLFSRYINISNALFSFSVDSFQFDIRADGRVHSLQASIATVFYNVVLMS